VDVTDEVAPMLRHVGMVTSALWSDVDGDGWPDLLLTLEWGQVKYFHNVGGKKFEDWTEKAGFASAGTGWWQSIATADFNGDGRPDFVVGNVGLNTQYRCRSGHPALLFSGDFAGRGSQRDCRGLLRGRPALPVAQPHGPRRSDPLRAPALPLEQRLRHARPCRKSWGGPPGLSDPPRGHGTAKRRFPEPAGRPLSVRALPLIAQIAPADGIVAGDFDGDGHAGHLHRAELLCARRLRSAASTEA
jgi:hypothetical protein